MYNHIKSMRLIYVCAWRFRLTPLLIFKFSGDSNYKLGHKLDGIVHFNCAFPQISKMFFFSLFFARLSEGNPIYNNIFLAVPVYLVRKSNGFLPIVKAELKMNEKMNPVQLWEYALSGSRSIDKAIILPRTKENNCTSHVQWHQENRHNA